MLFLVIAAVLESQTAKNITDLYKKHSGQKVDQFQPIGLAIFSFSCLCYFSNSPLRPSWIVNLHKYEKFHLGTIVIKSEQNTFMFSRDIAI